MNIIYYAELYFTNKSYLKSLIIHFGHSKVLSSDCPENGRQVYLDTGRRSFPIRVYDEYRVTHLTTVFCLFNLSLSKYLHYPR